ncbi:serine/threonine-protein kinase [Actinomadura rifamycini]|uniref:serine/threonine-protein kinase n=1 Tax=Actinomadura rifamycini TaxID=31962 RepID=UPI00146F35C3|nr:serine/threonine-protein kinase [Actinomadura rifamycini]
MSWGISGFREVRELGRGTQGRVVLARHVTGGPPVAIKYLPAGSDPIAREVFRHEARMLARVRHPNVARLYRLFEDATGAAIVMEVVDGVSLKRILADRGALTPEASLLLLKGSLLGLAAAHAAGVVHRDYKPANVVVRADGLSKLIDFGVAARTGGGGRVGTPAYMAPEQWRGEPVTPAADVYAAACVFYECVTGHRPYASRTGPDLMAAHVHAPVPADDVPAPLRTLVARGLAKSPAARPAGAAAFAAELEDAAARAYGPGWQDRAARTLAVAAAAFAPAFPLAAAASPAAPPGPAAPEAPDAADVDPAGTLTGPDGAPDVPGADPAGTLAEPGAHLDASPDVPPEPGAAPGGGLPAPAKAALATAAIVTAAVVAAIVFGTPDGDDPARRVADTPTPTATATAATTAPPTPTPSPPSTTPTRPAPTPTPTHTPTHTTPTPTHTTPSPTHTTPAPAHESGTATPSHPSSPPADPPGHRSPPIG